MGTESGLVGARGWWEETWELLCDGPRVSGWGDEKALEMGGGDGCLTTVTYFMPLNGTRKNG